MPNNPHFTTKDFVNLVAERELARVASDVPIRIALEGGDTVAIISAAFGDTPDGPVLILRPDLAEMAEKLTALLRASLQRDSQAMSKIHDEIAAALKAGFGDIMSVTGGAWPNKQRSCAALAKATGTAVSRWDNQSADEVAMEVHRRLILGTRDECEGLVKAFQEIRRV